MNPLLLKIFALWARAKGVKRPDTKEGMDLLFNEFLADQPNWAEIEGNYPLELGVNGANIHIQNDNGEMDDFDELVAERGRVLEEVGGDDLAREAVMQERARKRLQKEAPFVRYSPPSSRKAILGGVAAVSTDGVQQVNNQRAPTQATVAFWTAEEDSETTPVTVVLGVQQQRLSAVVGTNKALKPFGIIKFGTRCALEAEVDISQGTQVIVAGAECVVDVSMDPPVTGSGLVEVDAAMTLSAALSFGPVDRPIIPSRTKYFGFLLRNTQGPTTAIPRFAATVNAIWRAAATIAVDLIFMDVNGATVGRITLAASTNLQAPISIPPNAQFFAINNNQAGADLNNYQVVFGLNL